MILAGNGAPEAPKNKVLLISLDGFRASYLDDPANQYCTGNIQRIFKDGVRAEYMQGSFATKTFPSHFTMATGLWEEVHGIVGNKMLDPLYPGEIFNTSNHDPKSPATPRVSL